MLIAWKACQNDLGESEKQKIYPGFLAFKTF